MVLCLCYLVLLAAAFYFVLLYDFQGLRFLLGCAVCIPLANLPLLLAQVFLCRVGMQADRTAVARGEPLEVRVTVEARGPFPMSRVLVRGRFRASGRKAVRVRLTELGLEPRRVREIPVKLEAPHCGRVQFAVTKAVIYDYLGFFSMPARGKGRTEICVMPNIEPISGELLDEVASKLWLLEGERDGDLLLRDFRPEDGMHRVYWKLAAKDGELQVRDFEESGSVTFLLNFSESFCRQPDKWDVYLDRACSLLYFFTEARISRGTQKTLEVVWRKAGVMLGQEIRDADTLQAWVQALLMQERTGTPLREETERNLLLWLHLEEDGRLYFGEQCVYG